MMNDRRAALAATCSPPRLPSAYREVEWIGVDGTQWIVSNYAPTGAYPSKIECRICAEDAYLRVFGARNSASSALGTIGFWAYNTSAYNTFAFGYYQSSSTGHSTTFGTPGPDWHTVVLEHTSNSVYTATVDEILQYSCSVQSPRSLQTPLGIFAVNYDGASPYSISSGGKIAALRFWENGGDPVHDYVPCERISDGEIGLYDLATDVFLTNCGTGTFRKGGNV